MNNSNKHILSLEDFRAAVDQIVGDAADPESEIHMLLAEGRHYVTEAAKFDVEFARKMGLVVSSIEDLIEYAKARKERN